MKSRNFFNRYKSLRGVALLCTALLFFAACKKSGETIETPVARLMAFNLSADQDAVGFSLSGNVLPGNPLGFTNYTGGYLNIFPGQRGVEAFDFNTSGSLATTTYTFEEDKYYSAFFTGWDTTYDVVVAEDNFDSLSSTTGNAYVRFIHAVADSSSINVAISANGGSVYDEMVDFTTVSEFMELMPGDITLNISNEGEVEANRTISVEAGKVYTVLFVGVPGDTTEERKVQIRFIENGTLAND